MNTLSSRGLSVLIGSFAGRALCCACEAPLGHGGRSTAPVHWPLSGEGTHTLPSPRQAAVVQRCLLGAGCWRMARTPLCGCNSLVTSDEPQNLFLTSIWCLHQHLIIAYPDSDHWAVAVFIKTPCPPRASQTDSPIFPVGLDVGVLQASALPSHPAPLQHENLRPAPSPHHTTSTDRSHLLCPGGCHSQNPASSSLEQ